MGKKDAPSSVLGQAQSACRQFYPPRLGCASLRRAVQRPASCTLPRSAGIPSGASGRCDGRNPQRAFSGTGPISGAGGLCLGKGGNALRGGVPAAAARAAPRHRCVTLGP